jgi:hypothetical protein
MLVTKKSFISGIERTLEIPVTQEELDNWKGGMLAQEAFPNLTADQREFIMTGVTPEEWEETMKEDEE